MAAVSLSCGRATRFGFQLSTRRKMGAQEPAEQITEVGAALFWVFAFSDLVFYTPFLGLGLIGHALGSDWALLVLGAAFERTKLS